MRMLDTHDLEVGMYIETAGGDTWIVDGVGKKAIRLKDRNGKTQSFDHPSEPTSVKVAYEVTPEQAINLIEQELDGTEIAWTS